MVYYNFSIKIDAVRDMAVRGEIMNNYTISCIYIHFIKRDFLIKQAVINKKAY